MSKAFLLSTYLSRARAMAAGGASVPLILEHLEPAFIHLENRKEKISKRILRFAKALQGSLKESERTGAPIVKILRSSFSFILREERLWSRICSQERQFAFQAAIALVLPWSVAGLYSGLVLNKLIAFALTLQVIGVTFFYFLISSTLKIQSKEKEFLMDLLTGLWVRSLAGCPLWSTLDETIEYLSRQTSKGYFAYAATWKQWLMAIEMNACGKETPQWPNSMPDSSDLSQIIVESLYSGAPCAQTFQDYLEQLHEETAFKLEDALNGLPTRLSLVFCIFFTPAFFLIIVGAVCPDLAMLWT